MKNRAISENFMNALLSGEFKHIINLREGHFWHFRHILQNANNAKSATGK